MPRSRLQPVKVDPAGKVVGDSRWPVNPAGFTVHAAIHAGIAGAHCVMHTHTTAGMAVACSAAGLSMSNFYAAQLFDKVAYHPFEGITVHEDEGPRLVRHIGDKPAVILRNHGLLAWGDTLARTFSTLWLLNRACEIQLATLSMGAALPVSEDIRRKCTRDSLQFDPRFGAGEDVFAALTREIDAIDSSYKGIDCNDSSCEYYERRRPARTAMSGVCIVGPAPSAVLSAPVWPSPGRPSGAGTRAHAGGLAQAGPDPDRGRPDGGLRRSRRGRSGPAGRAGHRRDRGQGARLAGVGRAASAR